MSNNAVVALSLYKKYNNKTAINDFSLTVKQGEIHALVGPTGSGKTSILNILAGTVRPSNGTAKVFNRKIGSIEARKIIGYVPNQPAFYPSMTVLDYLVYMGMLSGVNQLEAINRAIALLKKVDLNTFKDKNPRDLTLGMKMKIALVQSLLSKPYLLLMDEPVTGMDQAGKIAILQIIKELSILEGITVIISSSLWTDVAYISDRMSLLHEGKVLLCGETQNIENLYLQGVFSLQASDNELLLEVLKRMVYLKHIIRTEKGFITVITDEAERFKKDLPGIIYKLELELQYFQQEAVTTECILQYFLVNERD